MLTKKIYLYPDREDVSLTTYVLDDSMEMLKGGKRPAVIVCPGGGYLMCSDREAEPVAMKFVSMGYHAFVLRYSVYMRPGDEVPEPGQPLTVKDHCRYPAQIRETAQAFLTIREHADEWHVDVDKIAVCGFSAGAHNAALYVGLWNSDIITEYYHQPGECFRPAAMILGYMGSDYPYIKKITYEEKDPLKKFIYEYSMMALAGTSWPEEDFLIQTSPISHVGTDMPPAFIWATFEDEMLNVQNSVRFAHALADAHVPFELHIFESGAHGYSLATQASAEKRTQIDANAVKWTELAEAWLEKRFALQIEGE